MAIKYIRARMPGRTLIHLLNPTDMVQDERFGAAEFVVGYGRTLCGKTGVGWIVGSGEGEPCRRCSELR